MILSVTEYNNYTHTDLDAELSARLSTFDGNGAEAFIQQVEDFINVSYMTDYGFMGINDDSTEHQVKQYKLAIIYQVMYELQNGSLWNDSGYNLGLGIVANPIELRKLGIPQHVHNFMKLGGMANLRRG